MIVLELEIFKQCAITHENQSLSQIFFSMIVGLLRFNLVSSIKSKFYDVLCISSFTQCVDLPLYYNHRHNILVFLMPYQIFFSSQVKRSAINTNKYGIDELLHELSNSLRLRILDNQEIPEKSQNFIKLHCLVPNRTSKMKILSIPAKNCEKTVIEIFPQCTIPHENQNLCQIFCP